MAKSLKSFHKHILLILITMVFCHCTDEYPFYVKTIPDTRKEELAKRLISGRGWYYQGTPAEMLVFEEAIKIDPNNAKAYREIGVPYLKRGFPIEFNKYYSKAVELDPLNWSGWTGYLYLYFYRDYERAINLFDATDTLTPNFVDYPQSLSVNFMRGIAYMQLQELDTALRYFSKHTDHETERFGFENIESKAFWYKAICHYKMKNFNKAKEDLMLALSIDDNIADIYYWMTKVNLAQDDIITAKTNLIKAKKLFDLGNYNSRSYVESFYQIYKEDLNELETQLLDI